MIKRRPIIIDESFAKRFIAALMGRAAAGQPFIITRAGAPSTRIVALDDKRRRAS